MPTSTSKRESWLTKTIQLSTSQTQPRSWLMGCLLNLAYRTMARKNTNESLSLGAADHRYLVELLQNPQAKVAAGDLILATSASALIIQSTHPSQLCYLPSLLTLALHSRFWNRLETAK